LLVVERYDPRCWSFSFFERGPVSVAEPVRAYRIDPGTVPRPPGSRAPLATCTFVPTGATSDEVPLAAEPRSSDPEVGRLVRNRARVHLARRNVSNASGTVHPPPGGRGVDIVVRPAYAAPDSADGIARISRPPAAGRGPARGRGFGAAAVRPGAGAGAFLQLAAQPTRRRARERGKSTASRQNSKKNVRTGSDQHAATTPP